MRSYVLRAGRWSCSLASACIGFAAVSMVEAQPTSIAEDVPAWWSTNFSQSRTSSPGRLFESIPARTSGITLTHEFPADAPISFMQEQGSGSGVCVGDYDGDGWPDVFITNFNLGARLYRNLGDFRFEDVTACAGVATGSRWCQGASFADIDNDGDLDLYVCVFNGVNLLFINQGNGTFREEARTRGLDFSGASLMAAFGDYDRDGALDVFVVTHRINIGADQRLPRTAQEALQRGIFKMNTRGAEEVSAPYREFFELIRTPEGRTELVIAGQLDRLYRNRGDGTFTNVTAQAGIHGYEMGLAAVWWDYNGDHWPDIYVSNDHKGVDRLYRNNRDGTFTDVAREVLPHVPLSSMGTDTGDVNNDGWVDLLATDMAGTSHARRALITDEIDKSRWFTSQAELKQYSRNALFLGLGLEQVFEVAYLAELDATDWTWSPKFADFDNDGWLDLFVANGMSRDFLNSDLIAEFKQRGQPGWRNTPVLREKNLAFRNLGDLRFEPAGPKWGLDRVSASFGAAVADLDRDGDLDLIVTNFGEPVSLYRNTGTSGHSVLVRLKGRPSNSWGIGSQVTLVTKRGTQTRYLTLASGFMSANEPLLHFGLGEETNISQLRIVWPSGTDMTLSNLPADRAYTIAERSSASSKKARVSTTMTLIETRNCPTRARHREVPYDDFAREPLLPWKLSQLGPGLAVGDVNGDGLDDFYLTGAAGQAGQLFIQETNGCFHLAAHPGFQSGRPCDELGALFFDADGDGDLDLLVAAGGAEAGTSSASPGPQLYLNDGHGAFRKAPDSAWPAGASDASSVVAAADFDRDGDLDVFVGGRFVPGQYPATPRSCLLLNRNGNFERVGKAVASDLEQAGLVTSAVWSDVDDDGWLDLLVTCEWGSLKLFRNRQGHLVDETAAAGFGERTGFWQGIAARDVDGDGDIDYIVTNLGLNTRYQASSSAPFLCYYGDLDGSGSTNLLELRPEAGEWFPMQRRRALLAAMPRLTDLFPTATRFAQMDQHALLSLAPAGQFRRLEVNTLESGVWLNDGHARFTFHPLPRLAQNAPSFGVIATEMDGDGHPDLLIVQNSSQAQFDTGRMRGGLGLLLRGRSDGSFVVVPPLESGVILPQDARSIGLVDSNSKAGPLIVIGCNDTDAILLSPRPEKGCRLFSVRLRGPRRNPTGLGAKVTIAHASGLRQTAEVSAGGGYLSQVSAALYFGNPEHDPARSVQIRWPDGTNSVVEIAGHASLNIPHPSFEQ